MKRVTLLLSAFILFQTLSFSQTWTKETKLVASDREEDEGFGHAVARTDDIAVITSIYEDEDENGQNPIGGAGAAYIFAKQANGKWVETQKIVASDRQVAARFGQSCAILGTTIIIGAEEHENMEGAVYVYEKGTDGIWKQSQKIVAPDKFLQSFFGCSVAAGGNYLVIGARYDRTDANGGDSRSACGSAYVYKKGTDNLWTFNKKLTAISRRSSQQFGTDVAIFAKRIVIGAPGDAETSSYPDRGALYVFELDIDDEWMPIQKITPTARTEEKFGSVVDMNKDVIAAGAYTNCAGPTQVYSETGAAYAFEKDKSTGEWKQMAKFVKSNPHENDHFGYDVSIHNSYLVISGRRTNGSRGSIFMFNLSASGTWTVMESVESSHAEGGDYFGTSVDIWNGNIIVGAPGEDHDLDEKNKLEASGAAFILEPGTSLSFNSFDKSVIQVQPNPSAGTFLLKTNKPFQNARIQIMDMKGQLVHEQSVESEGAVKVNLPSGIYQLSLYNDYLLSGISRLIILNQ